MHSLWANQKRGIRPLLEKYPSAHKTKTNARYGEPFSCARFLIVFKQAVSRHLSGEILLSLL